MVDQDHGEDEPTDINEASCGETPEKAITKDAITQQATSREEDERDHPIDNRDGGTHDTDDGCLSQHQGGDGCVERKEDSDASSDSSDQNYNPDINGIDHTENTKKYYLI
ncbi:hypothetical protein BS50DRAFT_644366 [Corynespora cassiicola Philippines]|uniref:Uncharacterized protein n=1 Tax=Corynespora cassiicola Philippines TaxID=1448308 RepID=A0A2T2PCT1_CORCC|nr:hypothetical protein BS50DRAFT_644366 [Corynespora cassiicola Philippines]